MVCCTVCPILPQVSSLLDLSLSLSAGDTLAQLLASVQGGAGSNGNNGSNGNGTGTLGES